MYQSCYGSGYGSSQAVTYAPYDPNTGKYSIAKGLEHSANYLSVFDRNGNGRTETNEMPVTEQHLDLNNDGVFSAGEHLAYNMFKDSTGNMDGQLTKQEIFNGNLLNQQDPNYVKSKVQQIYNQHNLAQREGMDGQPGHGCNSGQPTANNNSQNFMQMFMMMFMMMFMGQQSESSY